MAGMDDVPGEVPPPGSVPDSEKLQPASPGGPSLNNVWQFADKHIEQYEEVRASQTGMSFSRSMTAETNLDAFPGVVWQWQHKTGWRDYDQRSIVKIETAYRQGESKVRVQTGKELMTPMELFFADMLQHDPISTRTRSIQRVGPWSQCDGVRRFLRSWMRVLMTGRPRREVFAEYEIRRRKLKEDIDEKEYGVVKYYKSDGYLTAIVTSPRFFAMTMLAVFLNTVWLSIDSDYNNAATLGSSEIHFQVVEHLFCVFFTVEMILRFGAFEHKRDCFRDTWFSFDFALALIMILEIWILPLALWISEAESEQTIKSFTALRLMRLLRLTRIARLLRAVPEVLTLLKGISLAFRGVATTVILLGTLTFVFGIIFKKQVELLTSGGDLTESFKSVWTSMVTLCFVGTLLDGPASLYIQIDSDLGRPMALVFLLFIFLTAFTVLNMLIGVLCQVVTEVSEQEHEESQINYLKDHLLDILDCYDTHHDKTIGRKEFELLMMNLEMREAMVKFGTDSDDLAELADVLFSKSPKERLSFKDVLSLVLRLKGGNTAQVTDIVDLRDYVRQRADNLEIALCKLTGETFHHRKPLSRKVTVESGSAKLGNEEKNDEEERLALRVRILSARGLRNADFQPFNGKSDCFCQCVLVGKAHSMVETKVVDDDLDPHWNEEFVIKYYTPGDFIKFTVLDQDNEYIKAPDLLGSVVLQAGHYEADGFDGELQLDKAGRNRQAFLKVQVEVMSIQGNLLRPSRHNSKNKPDTLSEQPQHSSLSGQPGSSSEAGKIQSIVDMLGELCKGQQALRAAVAQLGDRLQVVERSLVNPA
eukprot:TRINITY_DN103330_c0_g1_i1.p1 TRINITY_DN103330_c0_g1~~TRINITY_DN103330_c0_g1_i1.p1  ORF type:complete len:817 (+),score=141.41 TRINITY_DN103330_c0_g1_i1:31-2481(+)